MNKKNKLSSSKHHGCQVSYIAAQIPSMSTTLNKAGAALLQAEKSHSITCSMF